MFQLEIKSDRLINHNESVIQKLILHVVSYFIGNTVLPWRNQLHLLTGFHDILSYSEDIYLDLSIYLSGPLSIYLSMTLFKTAVFSRLTALLSQYVNAHVKRNKLKSYVKVWVNF